MPTAEPAPVTLRSIAPSVFLPSLLFGIGQGAVAPVIALTARDLGASVGVASLVVALSAVGQLAGDLPAGSLAARVGERRAMIGAVVLVVAALACCVLATEVWMLGAAIAVLGAASAMWGIARHSYVTERVPYRMRARALSTLGGTFRVGSFLGPFLGAAAMAWLGTDGAYGVHLVMSITAACLVAALVAPGERTGRVAADGTGPSMKRVLAEHARVYRTLGIGVLMVGAVRSSRNAVIPLWADHIGLDAAATSLIFGVAACVDMTMFYPAGKVMDHFGRVWAAVPCLLTMAGAYAVMPLTGNWWTLTAAATLLAFGNGMGSGIIMTLGSDMSPAEGRAKFLGGWRLCSDLGGAGGPLLISGITVLAALGPALLAIGGVGLAGAAAMARWIPRPQRQPAA